MLLSLALLFLCGMGLGSVFTKLKLPGILGMILAGVLLGPYVFDLLDPALLRISGDLRTIALIIILMRAGLNLNMKQLKKVGRSAVLLCFVPACFEIVGMLILAPMLFDVSLLEAAIMGTVVAAVSPAVIVPRMLKLMEQGYGTKKRIPQMIMAGASVDDIVVLVLFTAFTGLMKGGSVTPASLLLIPTSIVFGLVGGILAGLFFCAWFQRITLRDSGKVVVLLSICFLFVTLESALTGVIGFSGLLAVMAFGTTLQQKGKEQAKRLSWKLSKLWVGAEVALFVLVGATINISYVRKAGVLAAILIIGVLVFRLIGVLVCLIQTPFDKKECTFFALAYIPKATVQAAIGGLPLAMGLACGEMVLTVAVVSILITAPLGAILMDCTYKKLLHQT